ncbi:MAG: hypothetical protein K2N09_07595 [Muribaculaceae bacterium]|nr:hypothetical protein [Muribaculaceae bacterium]
MRLIEIAERVSDSPEKMLDMLDSVDVCSLKESDRYFHALLCIKAKDKAYVRHTTDSVILRVIAYYSRHKGSGFYPEALYYGGRVYSDIGDAPTALRYFQDALDALPEGKDDGFRATILAQTGWLLNSMRIYSEAARYLEEAITLRSDNSDSIKIMYDTQLLGAICVHQKDYEKADSCIRKALYLANKVSPIDTLQQNMYLAAIHMERNNMDSALYYIRRISPPTGKKYRNMINAYAANIYLQAGISDSAYIYAQRLISSGDVNYQKNGYYIILNPKLRSLSSPDSLLSYSLAYNEVLDEYLDRHDGEQMTIQSSLYNYQIHERERTKAEEAKRKYMYAAVISLILVLLLCIAMLYIRNRSMRTILQYHKALDDIKSLKKTISAKQDELSVIDLQIPDNRVMSFSQQTPSQPKEKLFIDENKTPLSDEDRDKYVLRERLKEELLTLQKAGEAKKEVPESILSSSVYDQLQKYLQEEKRIPDSDKLWFGLEEEVLKVSPEFKSGLYLLVGDKLKEDAYHMALLIKCGMTPTELTVLVGRSKGAVSSRRGYICEMIFGQKLGAKVMDDIIRLL